MTRGVAWLAAGFAGAFVAVLAVPAQAEPPCGRGWRKGEWCGHYYAPPPVVVVPPRPVYVAPPPPVVYAPPPPVVYAPPPVVYAPAPAPGLSIGVNIPLR